VLQIAPGRGETGAALVEHVGMTFSLWP